MSDVNFHIPEDWLKTSSISGDRQQKMSDNTHQNGSTAISSQASPALARHSSQPVTIPVSHAAPHFSKEVDSITALGVLSRTPAEHETIQQHRRVFPDFLRVLAAKEMWLVDASELEVERKWFAEGAMATVHRAMWRGSEVCVKRVRAQGEKSLEQMEEDLVREIEVHRSVRHPNICLFMGASFSEELHLMLILELIEGPDFVKFFSKTSPSRQRTVALDLSRAICFLHHCNPVILHRDIKPNNILIDQYGRAKLADLGLAKFTQSLSNGDPQALTGKTGTRRYMSPEVATSNPYGAASDVYSLGATLYAAYSGESPFEMHDVVLHEQWMAAAPDTSQTEEFLLQGFPSAWGMPDSVRKFLLKMVHPIASRRPGSKEVVAFFQGQPTRKGSRRSFRRHKGDSSSMLAHDDESKQCSLM